MQDLLRIHNIWLEYLIRSYSNQSVRMNTPLGRSKSINNSDKQRGSCTMLLRVAPMHFLDILDPDADLSKDDFHLTNSAHS